MRTHAWMRRLPMSCRGTDPSRSGPTPVNASAYDGDSAPLSNDSPTCAALSKPASPSLRSMNTT
ncbi:hypothetical protein C8Q76DRAFT_706573 [Earliella scabrosa]|nr:hypothetical protein C8Q76DRAFT_706573 [Earliella scabrosa]